MSQRQFHAIFTTALTLTIAMAATWVAAQVGGQMPVPRTADGKGTAEISVRLTPAPTPPVEPALTPSEKDIKQALGSPITASRGRISLTSALDEIKSQKNIEVQIDSGALREAGIDPSATGVDFNVKNIALRSALNLLLSQFGLTYVVKDEVLLITSKEKASTMLQTRLFDVHDLALREGDANSSANFEPIIEAIRMSVNPQSWDVMGGPCSITPFNASGICALIVVQPYGGQEQIERLLAELRYLKPKKADK